MVTGSGAARGAASAWPAASASAASAAASAARAGRPRADGQRGEQREGAADEEGGGEGLVEAGDERLVGARGQLGVGSALGGLVEAVRLLVERPVEVLAGIDRAQVGERELGELELLDRRQAGVQHERGAPQAQLVDGAVELVGCQRRQEGERDGDPQMAGGE
jgi:hypothetical protein